MNSPVIEFKNFGFQYDAQAKPTLYDINLSIHAGEKILIVGPSGCGKSTLAHCINGLIPFSYSGVSTGSLCVHGKETKEQSIFSLSKTVGTVLQDPDGQFIGLTVGEDIAFSLENDCTPQDKMRQAVERAASLVGIEARLGNAPHALSGGQKQRVSLAGVMVDEVDVLLFDEPLANLDPATGKQAIDLIDRIGKQLQSTIVIIEHRLEDVLYRPVDRIVLMYDGRIVADLPPEELLSSAALSDCGIREPLYLTALKYAGCPIRKEMHPQSIGGMDLSTCGEKLGIWYESVGGHIPTPQTQPVLEARGVSFRYDTGDEVLHDVSFTIDEGEMLSIVGKNGAGKSTLSKLICGFEKQTVGDLLYQGKSLAGDTIKERAQRIGMVMQNPNQMISKPLIFEEVALGLQVRGTAPEEITRRVESTLKICGLYPFRKWPISALSFGQKKRVTIASILVLEPKVIILDEPTAGQDFRHYTEMMEFLRALNRSGVTVILITHDMHLMLEYTNRSLVFTDGSLVADCSPASVLCDREMIEKANLKETSLFELCARTLDVEPSAFVQRFIDYDRRERGI